MQVTLEYAQEHFADLVSAVNRSEKVEIAQAEPPSLKLTGLKVTKPVLVNGKRVLGARRGDFEWPAAKRPRTEPLGSLAGGIHSTGC